METTKETGLLSTILPPPLEDAGLEDCALPPDSIKEAFAKAATAVKSRIFTHYEDEAHCVQDPWPEQGSDAVVGASGDGAADALIGMESGVGGPGACVAEKGRGVLEEGKDDVVVGGADAAEGKEGERDCIGGLEGLEIGDKKEENDDEEDEEEGKKPTLVEGFV